MYAESGLMYPYFQNFCPEVQQFEDYYCSQKPNASMGSLVQTSTVSDYDLGGEGDLFKAPEPIIEQPQPPVGIDPMIAALSMISCGEDVMSSQALRVADFENGQLIMNQVLYECEKDLLAKEAMETSISDVLDIKIPVPKTFQEQIGTFQRSVSSGCLNGASLRPNFLDFPGMDFGEVYGLRRAFSEGDMKALGNANVSLLHSPLGQPQILGNDNTEDRRQKLNRYRNKKTKRNFGRKIKYACRKALADSQPRIRGRFAKTD